jgi:hypothetical protein
MKVSTIVTEEMIKEIERTLKTVGRLSEGKCVDSIGKPRRKR